MGVVLTWLLSLTLTDQLPDKLRSDCRLLEVSVVCKSWPLIKQVPAELAF
jgi:hypothetical protein